MPNSLVLGILVASGTFFLPLGPLSDPQPPSSPPRPFSASGVAIQLGLTPASLTASGASASHTGALLAALHEDAPGRSLVQAHMHAIDSAETPAAVAQARAALAVHCEALRTEVLESVPAPAAACIGAVCGGLRVGLPADLAAVVGAGVPAERVKRMLIAERRAHRMQTLLAAPIATELASLRASPMAVAVRERLATDLAEAEAAFAQFWSE